MNPSDPPPSSQDTVSTAGRLRTNPLLLLGLIVAAGAAARAWLLFGTRYVPGINGAYYLVQARALLTRGVLGIPDMPLTFHLHAGLAWTLERISGISQADALIWAVKLSDSLLPPLMALPVFVLVRRWARARGQGDAIPLVAAALACLSWPWLRMVGDFQKNSLALVWLALLAMTLHHWLAAPTVRRGLAMLACVLLLGLTHIGVLGAALVMLAAVMLVFVLRQRDFALWRHVLPWMLAGAVLLGLAATLVLWKYDPARIHRLVTALTNPARFSSDGNGGPGGPGGPHGPGGLMDLMRWLPGLGFALAVVPALVIVWRQRKVLPAADVALIAGMGLTVLAMTGPWFGMDKAMRFSLIALGPAILLFAFVALHVATPWRRRSLLGGLLLLGLGGSVPSLLHGGRAVLSDAAMDEMKNLAKSIPEPERSLVSAQHGVEWWSAWFLQTHIAHANALRTEDWSRYRDVYFLEVNSGLQMPMFAPGDGRSPGPGPRKPSDRPGESGPPPPGGNPMMSAPIPPGAEVVHRGPCLTLARVATPPENVRTQKAD